MKKKILIIEDEEGIASAFQKQLTLIGGFEVEIALGGREATTKVLAGDIDLILLDLVMPEVDGMDLLRLTKDSNVSKNIPVIMLTNVTSKEARDEAKVAGADKFFVKTDVQPDELIKAINELIENT